MNLILLSPVHTIRELAVQRAQLKEHPFANRNMSSGSYLRLMCLAGIEVVYTVPLGSFIIYLNTSNGIQPWVSWSNIHYDFSYVDQIPSVVWHQDQPMVTGIELTRYLTVFCAFVFFAFFGFADEARRNYRIVYISFAKKIGLLTGTDSSRHGPVRGSSSFWFSARFTR